MTANVTHTNGKAEMAYIESDGATWWGGGQPMKPDASREEWAEACGFKWNIESAPVQFLGADGVMHSMQDRVVLHRNDNYFGLGVVSTDYNITQPLDTLDYMMRQAERIGAKMKSAGTLFGGRQFWSSASLEGCEDYILDPKDKVRRNLLMCSSADYSLANLFKFHDTRVQCSNTLSAGLGERSRQVKVSHKRELDFDAVDEKLGLVARETFATEIEVLRKLANTKLSTPNFARVVVEAYSPKSDELSEIDLIKLVGRSRPIKRILALAGSNDLLGFDMKGVRGTAWGGLNVVTQYIDHDNGARTIDRRWQRAMFTTGDKIKTRTKELLVSLSNGTELPACKLENRLLLELASDEN